MSTKLYILEDVSDTGNDFLRQALGTVWSKVSGSWADRERFWGPTLPDGPRNAADPKIYYEYTNDTNLDTAAGSVEDARGISTLPANISPLKEKYKIFKKIEINPSRIIKINDKTPIPNFKIPVRIFSDPEFAKSDKHWNKVFMGGVDGDIIYPRLIDQKSVFYDLAFHAPPYNLYLDYKAIYEDIGASPEWSQRNVAKIISKCNFYDHHVENYMKWAEDKHELLLPNYHFEINYRQDAEAYSDLAEQDLTNPLAPYPPPMWKLRKIRAEEKPYLNLLDYYFPKEVGGEQHFMRDTSVIDAIDQRNIWFGKTWIYDWTPPDDLKDKVVNHQKNIMFDHSYFTKLEDYKSLNNRSLQNKQNSNMFNITIEFNRRFDMQSHLEELYEGGSPLPPRSFSETDLHFTTPAETYGWEFRNSIERNNASAKFLEALKDLDSGALSGFKTEKMNFKAATSKVKVVRNDSGKQLLNSLKTENIKLESFNYLDFLAHIYNKPQEAVNDNYIFMGPSQEGAHAATYKNNLLYRFSNNANLMGVIDDSVKELQVYFEKLLQETDIDPETGAAYDITQEMVYKGILDAKTRWSEVLAYKIEKHGGAATGDSQSQNNIQNFWVFNSSSGSVDVMSIRDTQVKYGKEYTYKAYVYIAAISHKYKYSNFRLTKQTNNYDTDSDGAIDKYCIKFYEPISRQIAPQIFAISSVDERNPSGEEYSNLAHYNTFATSEYDISESPQLADFYLNVEPCVKIMKVPIFEKKIGVFDSPAGKVSNIPFYAINDSNKIGFSVMNDGFKKDTYPSVVTDADVTLKEKYLNSQCLYKDEFVEPYSVSPSRYIEVFRSSKKPTSYRDFKNSLISKIDLRIQNELYNRTDYNLFDKIVPNKKYYYLIRTVTENGMPGHCSSIIEAELINDGGYKYANFDTVDTIDFVTDDITLKTTSFKKLFQIEPSINQLFLDTADVDFTKKASTQMDKVNIGRPGDIKLWNKKFKIRLISRKTGKKTDLNVTFNIQEKDFS